MISTSDKFGQFFGCMVFGYYHQNRLAKSEKSGYLKLFNMNSLAIILVLSIFVSALLHLLYFYVFGNPDFIRGLFDAQNHSGLYHDNRRCRAVIWLCSFIEKI